ncbi:MAG TPA: hypothetical protein VJ792_06860 [Candidatus Nitrosotalea sp.]|nr:hypothetical protein [Candidatus Nitrosotalea sp.]
MLEVLVDPDVSVILAELEGGEKSAAHLSEKLQVSDQEISSRLSYAIEHGFVTVSEGGDGKKYGVDSDKLNKIMEADENFDGLVSGLTELDQFLN